jgi:hypothetical protein
MHASIEMVLGVKRKGVFVIFKIGKEDDHKKNYCLWQALVVGRTTLKGNLVKSLLLRFSVSTRVVVSFSHYIKQSIIFFLRGKAINIENK